MSPLSVQRRQWEVALKVVSSLTSWWWWWSLELAEGLALWSSFQALKDPQGHQGLGTNLQKALRGGREQ